MTDVLRAYSLLTTSSTRSQVSDVLQAIINALPFTIEDSSRAQLIHLLIKDLRAVGSKSSRLTQKDTSHALLALKTLGKCSGGSDYLTTSAGLSALLAIATNMKDDRESSYEALRCISNTLFLYDEARHKFVTKAVAGGDICVGLLYKATDPEHLFILSRILFLSTASPTTFLLSLVEDKRHGHTITEIISIKLDLVVARLLAGAKCAREAMSELLKFTFNLLLHYPKLMALDKSRTSNASRTRTVTSGSRHDNNDGCWSNRLDGLLPPLLRVYHSLPPTFPSPLSAPLTHVIHSLIYIPVVEKSLLPIWLGSSGSSPTRTQSYPQPNGDTHTRPRPMSTAVPKPNGRPVTSYERAPIQQPSLGVPSSRHSIDAPPSPQNQVTFSIANTNGNLMLPKQTPLDKALSVLSLTSGRHRRSPSPLPPYKASGPPGTDVVQRTLDLLEVSFAHYMPGCVEPDSLGVRERVRTESQSPTQISPVFPSTSTSSPTSSSGGTWKTSSRTSSSSNGSATGRELSEILSPLVTLLTRLCDADSRSRIRVANWLIPPSLFISSSSSSDHHYSRTTGTPLYKQPTFLGRCLRILLSTHPTTARLKDVVGELFWVVSGEDPWVLSSRVGYPLVRELLAGKGVMSEPLTPAPTPPPKEPEVGFRWEGGVMDIRRMSSSDGNGEMTEEEKEAEMEKMFGLLDRLERSGGPPGRTGRPGRPKAVSMIR
ncbi:hypothetical protein L218DRAFT_1079277 [Marasmius fiardii PR-910]|nr:hypothetical protein L218DRAFT_1079277 [Marasmius fiardii PR-910]